MDKKLDILKSSEYQKTMKKNKKHKNIKITKCFVRFVSTNILLPIGVSLITNLILFLFKGV